MTETPIPVMTEDAMRDLVKDCGLDWQRGYMPLFDGDPTNRYAVLIESAQATALEAQAAQIAERDAQIEALRADADAKQAEIDRLMLEFCPDEMEAKQMASWEEHQQSAMAAKEPK